MGFIADFSPLTVVLILAIAILTAYFHGPSYSSHTANNAPTILTSLGIFGTFLGVAIGLMSFDAGHIEDSVPALIEGLKSAFWSSIAGLLGALTIKFRHVLHILRTRTDKEQFEAATIDDLANVLVDIRQILGDDPVRPGAGKAAKKAAEKSMLKHLQLLREDNNQRLDSLLQSMVQYQERVVEANSQALVTALASVMQDFNAKIDEQYGDNFKKLNQAVGRMLDWQKSYSKQLDELVTAQKISIDVIKEATSAYKEMVTHTEVFSKVSLSIGSMLEGLQQQTKSLDSYLSGLSSLVGTASAGLPALGNYVTDLTDKLSASIEQNNSSLTTVLSHAAVDITDTVARVNVELADAVKQAHEGLASHVEIMLERTDKQMTLLDKAMEEQLTKALQSFGYQLTALSEKFVNDYTPLTDKLKQVVALAAEVVET